MSYYGGESPFSPSSPPPSQQGKEGLRGTYGATSPSPSPQAQAAADSASNIAGMRIKKGKLLGKGAFGAVYQAMNVMSGELLAIKQLPIAVDVTAHTLRGIEREIAINSSLPTHVNCVQYLGVQSTQRNIYIVMEHVSGGSIQSLLQSVGQFHEKTMRSYSNMILKGLQHLHKNNVVHQDIKGANVLIDEKGVAKIADFGCSKDLSTSHQGGASSIGGEGGASSTFHNAGTPLWMAPEVCRGENATKSSDIWSFGCLLLEMVTEERSPWVFAPGTSAFAVLYAIGAASRPPQPPQHLSSTARDFISKCLMLDPSKRPTVDELLRHPFLTQPSHHTHSPSSSSSVASPNGQQGISLSSHNGASHSPQGVTIQYANGSSSKAQKSEDITMQDWEADWETRHAGFEDVSKSRNANAHLGHEPSSPFLTRGPSGDTIGIGGVIAGGGKGINLRKIYLQQQERQHTNSGPTDANGSFYDNNGASKPMVRPGPRPNATSGGEEPSGRSAEFVLNAVADDDDDDDEGYSGGDHPSATHNKTTRTGVSRHPTRSTGVAEVFASDDERERVAQHDPYYNYPPASYPAYGSMPAQESSYGGEEEVSYDHHGDYGSGAEQQQGLSQYLYYQQEGFESPTDMGSGSDGTVVWQSGKSDLVEGTSNLFHTEEVADRRMQSNASETNKIASFFAKKFSCIKPDMAQSARKK